ncbi:ATP-binding protein [Pleomorphovibrio marinus]|uniref:ATP-binding protein n=1 Tax=Pleomorphovibrio marinus TaxID=2164132 RepID=UPI000E0B76C2|nr:ATP-binding protein [Pleomorphovibrio marinus]
MDEIIQFLQEVLKSRLDFEFGKTATLQKPQATIRWNLQEPIGKWLSEQDLSKPELVLLCLSLTPYIKPGFLHSEIAKYLSSGGDFPAFGGIKSNHHRGIIPTGETFLYLLGGEDPVARNKYLKVMMESVLLCQGILEIGETQRVEPFYAGPLMVAEEFAEKMLLGKVSKPKLSTRFPAQLIETELDWEDLVLPKKTMEQIQEIQDWLTHNEQLMKEWELGKKIKPGYRVMFSGPPGTGKTLTASLLGKYAERDVFRVDLSLVVSKYIGETEKNLSQLFDKAAHKDWILFFDEADALFGKRTSVRDAHDKYANQEVSYLLQRVEGHPGLVILASNFKSNIDVAFTRRFQSIVYFDFPDIQERRLLWEKNLPVNVPLEESIHLEELARRYPLTGANIVNIIHQVGLKSMVKKEKCIKKALLIQSIKNELAKEGKMY